jgi:hypothetical protein
MNMLFVGGPPRSGTTALVHYLNRHPEILLCMERYKWVPPRDIQPQLFTFERLLDYRSAPYGDKEETNIPREYHEELLASKDPERLKWIGDKLPAYVEALDRLSENNPGANFILTYRSLEEVAESFESLSKTGPENPWWENLRGNKDSVKIGVSYWNSAMRSTRNFIESAKNLNVLILSYHDFFHDKQAVIHFLSRFLDIKIDQELRDAWQEMSRKFEADRRPKESLSEEQQAYIEANKDKEAEQWVLDYVRRQRQGLDHYSPEAARGLVRERRLSAIRVAQERARARDLTQEAKRLTERNQRLKQEAKRLTERNQRLKQEARSEKAALKQKLRAQARSEKAALKQELRAQTRSKRAALKRVRNAEEQLKAIQSSRSWKILAMFKGIRIGVGDAFGRLRNVINRSTQA